MVEWTAATMVVWLAAQWVEQKVSLKAEHLVGG
jgi:hypothetical protein